MFLFDQFLRLRPFIVVRLVHGSLKAKVRSASVAGPEQVVDAMNGDIQAAAKLLVELREAYRGLPKDIQEHVTCLLRECSRQKLSGDERVSCHSGRRSSHKHLHRSASKPVIHAAQAKSR